MVILPLWLVWYSYNIAHKTSNCFCFINLLSDLLPLIRNLSTIQIIIASKEVYHLLTSLKMAYFVGRFWHTCWYQHLHPQHPKIIYGCRDLEATTLRSLSMLLFQCHFWPSFVSPSVQLSLRTIYSALFHRWWWSL